MKPLPFLLLPALAALAGCSPHRPETAAALPSAPARVTLARVIASDAPMLTEVTGIIRPAQRATLAAKVMGTVAELPVALGQPVRRGELLLRITAEEITARAVQARAQLNVVRRDLDRERALLTKGASTADLVRGLEDRFTLTEAMVREAETMLGYTELRAPFDGVVARKFVDTGDLAAPGHSLLEVEGTGNFIVEAGIPDSLAPHLAAAAPLLVEAPVAGLTFRAPLLELSSAADAFAHTVTAKLAVPADAAVRSGQFARVHVPAGRARALLVPATAVSLAGQIERVFIAEDGRAGLRLVKTGGQHDGLIEILTGLTEGESVIVQPPAGLREGQPLEVQP
jgi:RND family efflux transporter MFP subunit